MQYRAAIWIVGAFCTLPMDGIEAIAGLIPIHLHLKKLYDRSLLRGFSLPPNHIMKLFITHDNSQSLLYHWILSTKLTSKQSLHLKSPLIDMNNRCNEFFPSFSLLDKKISPGNCLHDIFPNHVSFHWRFQDVKVQIWKLNNIVIASLSDPSLYIVVLDASIKNQVATSISHIHLFDWLVVKTLYQAVNISIIEVELFAIRCGINQAIGIPDIKKIIVITNSLHAARRIFDLSSHPYQLQSTAISCKLREFFQKNIINSIKFWDCPSKENWYLYLAVNKESKSFMLTVCFPSMYSWDFSKKQVCDNIISQWKMTFQASDLKEKSFLELLDGDLNPLSPFYINGDPWLQFFSHSNSLCTRATRAIVNYAPISEYRLRLFPRENFSCPCGVYSIETQQHILYECKRFNNYWNPSRDTIGHFTMFLELNSGAFSFMS